MQNIGIFGSDTMLGKAMVRHLSLQNNVTIIPFSCQQLHSLPPLQLSDKIKSNKVKVVINAHNENYGLGHLKKEPVTMFMDGILNDIHDCNSSAAGSVFLMS